VLRNGAEAHERIATIRVGVQADPSVIMLSPQLAIELVEAGVRGISRCLPVAATPYTISVGLLA
jgi:hypothetical protein